VQPQDGLGGEILARMTFRANSIKKGLVYVHTPFSVLDHVEVRGSCVAEEPLAGLMRGTSDDHSTPLPWYTRHTLWGQASFPGLSLVRHRTQGHEAALEAFMNLGADEIDIREVTTDFIVHNEKDNIWDKVRHPSLKGKSSMVSLALRFSRLRERENVQLTVCVHGWRPGDARLQRYPHVSRQWQLHG
jgi:hypothetical protein